LNKKFGLSHATLMAAIGIMLVLISVYVPILGIASVFIPVPFAIIGTLCSKKYAFLSLIATFFIIIFTVDPIYSVSVCILNVIPGLIIGALAKYNLKDENINKFQPIYGGIIITIICTITFYLISKFIFNADLINQFTDMLASSFKEQLNIMKSMNIQVYENINVDDLINLFKNMIPTVLFLQGLITSFITYYLETFILKRTRLLSLPKPTFRDFYLPGNAVSASLLLYMLVILLGFMKIGLYTDSILFNLQMVFDFMFIIQGIAVSIYYAIKWIKQGTTKNILISGIILGLVGTTGITFLGMLDSVIDFRKVRSYKST